MAIITTGRRKNDDGPSGGKGGPSSSSSDGGGSVIGGRGWICWSDGWKSAFGSNDESVASYRICLGLVLCAELVSRFQYLRPFYSDEG
jgi:hypothetical protein